MVPSNFVKSNVPLEEKVALCYVTVHQDSTIHHKGLTHCAQKFLLVFRTSICSEDIPEDNGLVLNNILFPEELLLQILTYVPIKTLPKCSLVCKKWNEIIKSSYFWRTLCLRSKNKKKITNKTLPVYAYYALELNEFFDVNLIKNNCGQEEFKHWKIKSNGGDRFRIENPPCGANVLPESPDFNDHQSCFATSFQNCSKYQVIDFNGNKLYEKIFDELRPKIYVSEW